MRSFQEFMASRSAPLRESGSPHEIRQICLSMDLRKDSDEKVQNDLFMIASLVDEAGNHEKAADLMKAREVFPEARRSSPILIQYYQNVIDNGREYGFASFFARLVHLRSGAPPHALAYVTVNPGEAPSIGLPAAEVKATVELPFTQDAIQRAIDAQVPVAETLTGENALKLIDFSAAGPAPGFSVFAKTETGAHMDVPSESLRGPKFQAWLRQNGDRLEFFTEKHRSNPMREDIAVYDDLEPPGYRPLPLLGRA